MDTSFLSGFVRGLTDEIGTRRAETRKREDAELQRRQDVLNKLYDGVLAGDVRPEHFAQIVKDQMAVGEALAGPRKRKGTKGFFTGESDLSGPLGGILDQLLSGQMDVAEGDEAAGPPPATPADMGLPAAPIPDVPLPRAISMPQAASPFASVDMGGSLDITPEQLPTPFNPPRFVDALQKPNAQQLSMQPPPVVPPAPRRPALLVNKPARARREAAANVAQTQQLERQQREQMIADAEAAGATPEELRRLRLGLLGVEPPLVRTPVKAGTITRDGKTFAQLVDPVDGSVQMVEVDPETPTVTASDRDFLRDASAALGRMVKSEAELTPADLNTVEAWRKRMRGTNPQPAPVVVTAQGIPAPPLPSNYRTAIQRVTSGSMSKDRKAGIEAEARRLHAEGNIEELNSYLRQVALEGEPTGIRESQISRLDTVEALRAAKDTIDELERLGVPMNKVSGTAESLLNRLGTSGDPRLVSLGVQLETALMNYRRGITGAAFSASEAAQYDKIWPSFSNDISLNNARIEGLLKSMETATSSYWTRKLGKQGAEMVGALPKAKAKEGVIDGVPVVWVDGKGWVVK